MMSVTSKGISGPFGSYGVGSYGCVLNTLETYYRIPLHLVESVILGRNTITYEDNLVGYFKWFHDLDMAVFRFIGDWKSYNDCKTVIDPDKSNLSLRIPLILNTRDQPCIIINKELVTKELKTFIRDKFFANYTDGEGFRLTKNALAFLRSGMVEEEGTDIHIEFHNPSRAIEWIKYLENSYTTQLMTTT